MAKCDRVWCVCVLWDTCDIRKQRIAELDSRVLQNYVRYDKSVSSDRGSCNRDTFTNMWSIVMKKSEIPRFNRIRRKKNEQTNESMVMYERETDYEARNKK